MTDRLKELLARVEGASGHDDALNVSLYAALWERYPIAEELVQRRVIPDFTASIDAALALVERVLPGWELLVGQNGRAPRGTCYLNLLLSKRYCYGSAATPPLAILAALLRAKINQEEAKTQSAEA